MAEKRKHIQLLHSMVSNRMPLASDLLDGELAMNCADEDLFIKNSDGVVVSLLKNVDCGELPPTYCWSGETVNGNPYRVRLSEDTTSSRICSGGSRYCLEKIGIATSTTMCSSMFYRATSLTSLDVSDFDTSKVTQMDYMFYNCSNLTSLDVSNFDTSNVTTMREMFARCISLTSLDVSRFDTSKVTDMWSTFAGCSSLTSLDVSNWDTSKVTNMTWMFGNCNSLTSLDLSHFDTSKVTEIHHIFNDCHSITSLNVSSWDVKNVVNSISTFLGTASLTTLDLTNWNLLKCTTYVAMFQGCGCQEIRLSENFVTNKCTNLASMFASCFNLHTITNLDKFDTSKVQSFQWIFTHCPFIEELDLSSWNVSSATNMLSMFYNMSSLTTLNLTNWDTRNVTDFGSFVGLCPSLRYVTLSSSFFNSTQPIPLNDASNLGFSADNTDNGWLGHLASVLPQWDGEPKVIQLPTRLKLSSWYLNTYRSIIYDKGYTVA